MVTPPASFDCAMRRAAYAYGKSKLFRKKDYFPELYYALGLNSKDCFVQLGGEESRGGSNRTRGRHDDNNNNYKKMISRRRSRVLRRNNLTERKRNKQKIYLYVAKNKGYTINNRYLENLEHYRNNTTNKKKKKLGSKDFPFGSIQAAIDYVAMLRKEEEIDLSRDVVVVVRGGTYYLSKPLQFKPIHNRIQIQAYPGENPIISGGLELKISKWKRFYHHQKNDKDDTKNNIWYTDISGQVNNEEGVPGLQIDGKRATRARYPNLPGGIEASCGYGCMISHRKLISWLAPKFNRYGNATYYTDTTPEHERPNNGWFEQYTIGMHGLCSVYDPPVSYWCSEHASGGGAFTFRTPSGLIIHNSSNVLPNSPYDNVEDALIFVWHPGRWANWMFEIESYNKTSSIQDDTTFEFGKGGNQGARGSNVGGDFFIENVLEELDAPNEFYYSQKEGLLYLFHNGTGAPPLSSTFVVPQLRTLLNITGTQWNPVRDIQIRGLSFQASRYTYMDKHAVPSAGDWALERNAAVFLQGTERITINNCVFDRLDGNGLMISGYNRNTTVQDSDFSYIGGTAIASWGYTNETESDPGRPGVHLENSPEAGVDGTDGEHPRYNTIKGCVAREVGLYEKQSSFYMQAKTAETTIINNVFFNGPRAGINFNDGFGGGDEVSHNLVFSTCRESGDHGPFNSWDRQPFLTSRNDNIVNDGGNSSSSSSTTMIMEWRNIHHNFFIDNYSPQENVDNDDGSSYYHTHHNLLVYGSVGMKNDFGGHDNHHYGNIYAYIGSAMSICTQLPGHEDYFYENKVVLTSNHMGKFSCNNSSKNGKTVIHDNEYYTSDGTFSECGMPLVEWQTQHGGDPNSSVAKYPDDTTIIKWAKELLDF